MTDEANGANGWLGESKVAQNNETIEHFSRLNSRLSVLIR
jgi:hypothetical protein